jgi:NADP-dependent 3-hydroxy acid dehydrogenase YdfG
VLFDYERTNSIARAIAYAIEQPADVEIDEFAVRRTAQDF